MKRFLTILAFVAIAFSSYAYDCEIDGIYYNLGENDYQINYDEASVTYKDEPGQSSYSGTVVIPEKITYNGATYKVTKIGDYAFRSCSGLTSITIPNSVTIIGWYAFQGCSNLTSITIPNSVTPNSETIIGDHAFSGCSGLKSITIPNSVTSIGEFAFSGCSDLYNVYCYAENVPTTASNVFEYTEISSAILHVPASVLEAYKSTLPWSEFGTIVDIDSSVPDNPTTSRDYVITSNAAEAVVTFSNSNKYEWEWDSANNRLRSSNYNVDGSTSQTTINIIVTKPTDLSFNYSVSSESNYDKLTILLDGTTIVDAISGSTSSTYSNTLITGSHTLVLKYSKDGSANSGDDRAYISNLQLTPKSIPAIGTIVQVDGIFYKVTSANPLAVEVAKGTYSGEIVIPQIVSYDGFSFSVTSIGERAFEYCSGLTSVTIPNSVTEIRNFAFSHCTSLTSFTIPNSVTSIWIGVFYRCSNLSSITIPNSVSFISESAFEGCEGLKSITIPNSVYWIGEGAFAGCSGLTSITIPNSVTTIGEGAFSGCSGLTSIEIPNSVKGIQDGVFGSCSGLTSITIPNSVTWIGEGAFRNCSSLPSITIPSSVTTIYDYAFYACYKLKELTCLASKVPALGEDVFYGPMNTSGVLYVPEESVEAYKAADQWKDWKSIVGIKESLELIDGKAYTNEEEKTYDELTFTKTFSSSVVNKWNALYVPISINIEDYLDDFDFAEIFNISPTEDTNGDGEIDGRDANKLIVNKMKTGATEPNKPYLIRPKNAGTYTFASADNVLYPAEEKSYSCSTMTDEYTFTGLYASQGVIGSDKYYMTINGVLDFSPTKTITVKPNRWIMTVKSRNGSSSSANAKAISLCVIGEDEGTTAIEHVDAMRNTDAVYNLNGVRMDSKNLPAGIYIKNGKKILVK